MAAYRRVYDSRHLPADCQEPRSAPEPYARQSSMRYLYLFLQPVQCSRRSDRLSDVDGLCCVVDGSWGEWAEWSECSAPCGGGIQRRRRACARPQHGGARCHGDETQVKKCNLAACSGQSTEVLRTHARARAAFSSLCHRCVKRPDNNNKR